MATKTKFRAKHPLRVRAAIRVLESLRMPRKAKFDMSAWGWHQGDHPPTEKNFCGTAACGFGWLSLSEPMNRLGLTHVWHPDPNGTFRLEPKYRRSPNADMAAKAFFGLPFEIVVWLFGPHCYHQNPIKPKHVAARMRALLKGLPRDGLGKPVFPKGI